MRQKLQLYPTLNKPVTLELKDTEELKDFSDLLLCTALVSAADSVMNEDGTWSHTITLTPEPGHIWHEN